MEEKSFPRGGTVPKQEPTAKDRKKPSKERRLFQENDSERPKKKDRKQKNERKAMKTIEGVVSGQSDLEHPEPLGKLLCSGMLVLGCVTDVGSYSIKMALPNGLYGTVPLTNISQAYTDLIQKFAAKTTEEQEEEGESVVTLNELFTNGEILPCKVMEYDSVGNYRSIKLSLNPSDVNEYLTAASIRNGMSIYGSVQSQEDHGYTLDIGIKGVKAFLSNKEAEKYIQLQNNSNPLKVGHCFMCGVQLKNEKKQSGINRVITVTVDPHTIQKLELNDSMDLPYSSLTTGMKVQATITQVVREGVLVSFLKYKGCIHRSHLPAPLQSYLVSQQLKATVLYIHPLSKAAALTCLPFIVTFNGVSENQFPDISQGLIIQDATVKNVDRRGVYLKLADKITGVALMKNISDDFDVNVDRDFPKGSKHTCRVLGFAPMDGLVNVTMKQSVIDEKFLSIDGIEPGSIIECQMKELLDNGGMSVTISKGISGFIPAMHLADVTLKHPEKKFKQGETLKCRVLEVKKERRNLILTHKKSLVSSKYPVITDPSQTKPGMMLEGSICSIKGYGVFVNFYNNLQGLVPKRCLSRDPNPNPEQLYYIGQVVRCRVKNVVPEDNKFILTFLLDEETKTKSKREAVIPADYEMGKFVKCKIIKKQPKTLDVELIPSKIKAVLPKMHLSDSVEMCEALWDMYKEGDILNEVMYLNKTTKAIVTDRHSMKAASREGTLVKDFDQLELGIMLPGSVKNLVSYGIFIEFPGGMVGLVPRQYAADARVPDLTEVYKEGQAVVAKVIEVDKEKKRFLASLRMLDCYHGDTDVGIQITEHYLAEKQLLLKNLENSVLGKLAVGTLCHGTVTQLSDDGAICLLDNGVKAIATKDHLEGEDVSEGSEFDCVILHVDVINECVEVTLESQLIEAVRKRKYHEGSSHKAKLDQNIKSKVLLVKEDFVLVSLKTHALGQLAYLPSKRHYNDVLERHQFGVGQVNPVVIKRIDNSGNILAILKIHLDKEREEDEVPLSHVPVHSLQIGDIKPASVRKVLADQIYIKIGQTHGRVHMTEMVDSIENGTNPLDKIKQGHYLKIRVIGFRDAKQPKTLPISHPNRKRSLPECSMRPSIVEAKNFPSDYDCAANNLKEGDKVIGFVYNYGCKHVWMYVRPGIQGKAFALNLTDDTHNSQPLSERFKRGKGYNATVLKVIDDKMVELSLVDHETGTGIEEGTVTKGLIAHVHPGMGIKVRLGNHIKGLADLTDLSDDYTDHPTLQYKVDQLVQCYVIKLDQDNKHAVVSLRKSRLNQKKCKENPDIQSLSDLKVGQCLRGFVVKNSHIGVLLSVSNSLDPDQDLLQRLSADDSSRLGHKVNGVIERSEITDKGMVTSTKTLFPVGTVLYAKILRINDKEHVFLSLLEEHTGVEIDVPERLIAKPKSSKKAKRKRSISASSAEHEEPSEPKKTKKSSEFSTIADPDTDEVLTGTSSKDTGHTVKFESSETKPSKKKRKSVENEKKFEKGETSPKKSKTKAKKIEIKEMKSENKQKKNEKKLEKGETSPKKSKTKAEKIEIKETKSENKQKKSEIKQEKNENKLEESETKKEKSEIKREKNEKTVAKSEKRKKRKSEEKKRSSDTDSGVDIAIGSETETKISDPTSMPHLDLSEGFSWSSDFQLPGSSALQGDISSDESDDEIAKKPVKKTKEELRQEKQEEEKRLFEYERRQLEGEIVPETADDFDRLVLQSPDSSLVWLRYMAFHLETSEIDKARAVAERALKTISFREEQEKMNVWVAYLNLENMYGSSDSLQKVLNRAVQQCDDIQVYLQMINIYCKSEKLEEAERLYNRLLKKHSMNKDIWMKFGQFYFHNNSLESARNLLQRCLKSLQNKFHVELISKFAQMEFKLGEPERGKTMFENILSTYPKRTDLWSIYIDMVTKLKEIDAARALFKRVTSFKLSAKKMKFFFKKHLEFEEKHGDDSTVAEVKQKALDYVESQGYIDD